MPLKVKDVMGTVAVAVHPEATFGDLVAAMRRFNVGAVAVIDADGRPVGVVSEDDLLLKETDTAHGGGVFESRKRRQEREKVTGMTAGEIMTSPALTVTRETPAREAARLMHTNRIKQLPVVDPDSGKIAGTVHQADLLKVFARSSSDILADVAAAIARLRLDPQTLTIAVNAGVVRVGGRVTKRSQLAQLAEAGRQVEGVVDLRIEAAYDHDDLAKSPSIRI
ncbi:CBS domain-containing protein [Streptosporangium sp. NPDC000396]|uniref:CBS domain-containing protein n=1 Tax=Streptosporangium sp. NPDC000396 TaxID=3366185 RepID=UPI0036C7792D